MAIRVNITDQLGIPGGITATSEVQTHVPSVSVSFSATQLQLTTTLIEPVVIVDATRIVSALQVNVAVIQPTVDILADVIVEPTALQLTAEVQDPTAIIIEEATVQPTTLALAVSIQQPSIIISPTYPAERFELNVSIHAPGIVISVPGGVSPALLTTTATVKLPTVSIVEDILEQPTKLELTASVQQPILKLDYIADELTATVTVIQPAVSIVESGLIQPAPFQVITTVLPPGLETSSTFAATALTATVTVNEPLIIIGDFTTLPVLQLNVTLNDPVTSNEILFQAQPFSLGVTLYEPNLLGDVLYEVTDPPWNVVNILLTFDADKSTTLHKDLPHMAGTLLYQVTNNLYNGADFNWTGGNIITEFNGDTVTSGIIYDCLYTIVQSSPGDTLQADIEVLNLLLRYEIDCLDTTEQETAELLAAILFELETFSRKACLTLGIEVATCVSNSRFVETCVTSRDSVGLCASISHE